MKKLILLLIAAGSLASAEDQHVFHAIRSSTAQGSLVIDDTVSSAVTLKTVAPLTADRTVLFPDADGTVAFVATTVSTVNGINDIACSVTATVATCDGATLQSGIATLSSAFSSLSGIVSAIAASLSGYAVHGTYGVSGGGGGSVTI